MTDPDAGARHDMLIRALVAEAATRDVMAMKEPDAIERSGHEHVARLLREAIAVLTEPLREAITALSEGEAPPSSPRAMLEYLAADTCRGNRHEVFLENCPVCWSRLQRLEGALVEGETSGALEIAPGVFRATTSSSIFPEGRTVPDLRGYEQHKADCYALIGKWHDEEHVGKHGERYHSRVFENSRDACSCDLAARLAGEGRAAPPLRHDQGLAIAKALRGEISHGKLAEILGIEDVHAFKLASGACEEARAASEPETPRCNICDQPILHELVCEDCLPIYGISEPETGWQPIATAPKGQEVLVVLKRQPEERACEITFAWFVTTLLDQPDGAWAYAEGGDSCVPTHWYPLPPPPAPERDTT